MGLETNERKNVVYFTGYEVEHTIAYGMFTLFVVGTPPLEEILQEAKKHEVKQIYFGTTQSFRPATTNDWKIWDNRITGCLNAGYWVALDFDVKHADELHEEGWCENDRFIPMISVKLPHIKLYNYNATLKIDDTTWGATNPGVWTHHLHSLMDKKTFTAWKDYQEDKTIK